MGEKQEQVSVASPGGESASNGLEAYYRQDDLWEHSRYEENPDQRLRARMIAAMIDPAVESVLDVGCGNGFVTRRLPGKRVVGLDPSPEALQAFDWPEKVLGTADALPFADGEFDAVVCSEVLEQLEEGVFQRAVSELARVASRFLIIGVPYRQLLEEGMTRCSECGARFHIDLHCRSFPSVRTVSRLWSGFDLRSAVLIGRRKQNRFWLIAKLRLFLTGPMAFTPFARCPECGAGASDAGARRGLRGRLGDAMRWRTPKRRVPNWVCVLLERTGGG
jgi:SAM-dependent methyltransferase